MVFSWGYLEAKYITIFRKEEENIFFIFFTHSLIIIHYCDGIIEANYALENQNPFSEDFII